MLERWTVLLLVCQLTVRYCNGQQPVEQVRMTVLDFRPRSPLRIQCYLSSPDTSATVRSSRIGNTMSTGANNNVDPGNPYFRSPRYFVDLNGRNNNDFGVFGCIATIVGKNETTVPAVRMRSDADIVPTNALFTQTVDIGDEDVSIRVRSRTNGRTDQFLWRKDDNLLPGPAGRTTYTIPRPVTVEDGGIYECYNSGDRDYAEHALHLLIVRACRANRWGPPECLGICDNCYNGGECDENSGTCICPAGFMGNNCQTACGDANGFGVTCEFHCTGASGRPDACNAKSFCRPHPLGCRCITGWRGLGCDLDCSSGRYGASCLEFCRCGSGASCNRYTGRCSNGRCAAGYSGVNCQVPQECPRDYYGTDCTEKCHCRDDRRCDRTTGECPNRECAPGYTSSGDNPTCRECTGGTFGLGCSEECHCQESSCNKFTGQCSGECLEQWVNRYAPNRCQTGIKGISITEVNPGEAVPVSCTFLQGEGGDLDDFELILSTRRNMIVTDDIETVGNSQSGNTRTVSFMASNVDEGDTLYCQLLTSGNIRAFLPDTVTFYVLPELSSPPAEQSVSSSSIAITWTAWRQGIDRGDPPVIGYIPYYKDATTGDWTAASDRVIPESTQMFVFTGLSPETNYTLGVSVVRKGDGGEGPMSQAINVTTSCEAPSSGPLNVTIDKPDGKQGLVTISWKLPPIGTIRCSSGIVSVTIEYTTRGSDTWRQVVIADPSRTSYDFADLSAEEIETLSIRMSITTTGGDSEFTEVMGYKTPEPAGGAIVIIIVALLFVILAVVAAVIILMRVRRQKKTRSDANGSIQETPAMTKNPSYDQIDTTTAEERIVEITADDTVYANADEGPPTKLDVTGLESYIKRSESDRELTQQFQLIDSQRIHPSEVGDKEENKTKNRFRNMVAYDHSRVVLQTINDDPHSDYYNANYVPNVHGHRVFIAAQGPNTASINDFWRMVWQEKVANIVMLTNLIERGKDRCTRYWPTAIGETKSFGTVSVKWTQVEQYADYEIRELSVHADEETRTILNWHFTTWPDMDTPEQPTALVEFARKINKQQAESEGPMVVHCSAGVGRTGTFIALCTLMDEVTNSSSIDVAGYVRSMRENRINMIQTKKQFIFLHYCLLEFYLTGETEMSLREICVFDLDRNLKKLNEQFRCLSRLDALSRHPRETTPEEMGRCRYPAIIPVEKKRPLLKQQDKTSTLYINACFTPCYTSQNAFIATQSPLPNTVEDFWRLIYDWKCPLIIMLNDIDPKEETLTQYWPDRGSMEIGQTTVALEDHKDMHFYVYRAFELSRADSKKVFSVKHMQLKHWDEGHREDVVNLIREMNKLQKDYSLTGPTVIHCINGVGRTGVYLTVHSEMDRMMVENKVNVFNSVRQLRGSHQNMVLSEEDYRLCHQLLKLDTAEPEYANV